MVLRVKERKVEELRLVLEELDPVLEEVSIDRVVDGIREDREAR